jgi:hypothetical protein
MSKNKSLRYNEGKPKWSLISFKALEPLVRVIMYGVKKYEQDNWKLSTDPIVPMDSLQRHLICLYEGEFLDKESKLPHIAHIMANAMFISYHTIVKPFKK